MLTRTPFKKPLTPLTPLMPLKTLTPPTLLMKATLLLIVLVFVAASARAQTAAPVSVAGRVTDGEHGVAGITVTLMSADPSTRFRAVARARTDGEGRYRLSNVAPGRYQIMPFAPVYVVQDLTDNWPPGKPLNLAAGEEVSDIDFRVERGSVITGRVTDADGTPVIGEQVSLTSADKDKPFRWRGFSSGGFDPREISTDDRGVYRLYGLPPGRYKVSVGQSDENGAVNFGRRKLYKRTFSPDTTDETQARVVEVTAGGEATDVDITLGRALKTYRASGRFVNAETSEAMPGIVFSYGVLDNNGQGLSNFGGGQTTNARGEFQIEGLAPGRYAVFSASWDGTSDFYSDAAQFEIKDAEVRGLVVKMHRGASVSGVVTVEGLSDRAAAARLIAGLRLYSFVERRAEGFVPEYGRQITVGADGSFRVGGLRAGKLRFSLADDRTGKLTITRIELNGANMSTGIDVAEGAQVTGARIVLAYGSGVVRGQVNYGNATLPAGSRVIAFARRITTGSDDAGGRTVEVDSRGRFVIEGLAPGEYEIRARVFSNGAIYQSDAQRVSLAENGDMNVTVTLDLSTPYRGGGRP
jgi:protocatechuate 3,4-dioxygenase beta subunit